MNARIVRLKELLKQSPSDSFILFALAKEFEKLSQPEKAIELLTTLLATSPNYVGAYYHLAALYQEAEMFDKAMETYIKGMEIAREVGDQHAYSELQNAKMNLEIELD